MSTKASSKNSWWASLLVLLVGVVAVIYHPQLSSATSRLLVQADANDQTCAADDSSCGGTATKGTPLTVDVINESKYRIDLYWDDGRFGQLMGTLDAGGGHTSLNSQLGHAFFVTRHGLREGLHHADTDEPHRFEILEADTANGKRNLEWVIPSNAGPSKNPCQDRYSICPAEAARGSCETAPGWMIVHCCSSCDDRIGSSQLLDPKVRCSKESLNMTENAWKPGDLNAMFDRWASSDEFQAFSPIVLSSPDQEKYGGIQEGPWVMLLDTFFSEQEAQALIKGAALVGFDRSTDQGKVNAAGEMEKVVSKTRTSSNAWCTGACEKLPEVDAVTARIEKVTEIPRSHYESFQILEYTHDQFYRMHHDSSTNKDDSPSGHRILTFFLYLSDVEEGGETYFNKLDLAVKPKRGRALIWPSVTNDDPTSWDPRMFHEAKDVIKGKKYAANHWIHINDYVKPNLWGCTGTYYAPESFRVLNHFCTILSDLFVNAVRTATS